MSSPTPLPSITTSSGLTIPLRTDINTIDFSAFTSATDWLREISKLSHHIMDTFNNDRVVQAAQLLTNCITTSQRLMSSATEEQKTQLQKHIDEMKNGDQYTYVRDVESELQALRISCREEKGDGVEWTKLDEHAGITTWYRKDPSYATHSFKVSGEVSAPLFNLIAIVYEIDLFAHWLPAIHSSTKLCHIDGSRFRMLAQMMIDVPWPVTNREVLFYGYGDVLDREVAIYFRSIRPNERFTTTEQVQTSNTSTETSTPTSIPSSSEPHPVELPPCPPKHVRCEVRQGGFIIHPIDANRSKVTVLFNIDPKLSLIPYWFLNMISSKFCYVLIELMRKHAPKLGPEFDSRIANNRRVYGEIERRLSEVEPQKEMKEEEKKQRSKQEDHTKADKSISKQAQHQSTSKQDQHQSTSKQSQAKSDENDEDEYDIVYHDANSPSPK